MNPITWPGEKFIVAYVVFALVLIALGYVLWYMAGRRTRSARVSDLTDDPYRVAYLRGGVTETLRVAIFNLVDRKILAYESGKVRVKKHATAEAVLRRPLDRKIAEACKQETRVNTLLLNSTLRAAADGYAKELGSFGLVSHGSDRTLRVGFGLAAAGLLAGVALTKIVYALSQGRTNIGFLVVATIIAVIWVLRVGLKRRTFIGGRMLSHLETLTRRMKDGADRMRAGGATNEALLLASVFGLYALPAAAFPMVEQIFPQPKASDSSGGSSDSGSSSCSSGCGGGGGCGGCGS